MIDLNTEKCRACTVKHLSAALTALDDSDELRGAYFCGNLVHAANHFMRYSQFIADKIRKLRLEAQDEQLQFIQPIDNIRDQLKALINEVTSFEEIAPEPEKYSETAADKDETVSTPKRSAGCPCRNKK